MFGTANFPVYRQLDQMDCGPTCLKMITEFYGRSFNLDYLREISCLQKGGVSLAALSHALKQIGIDSIGIKANVQELVYDVPLPAIVHWENNHFLVVYKTTSKTVFVSDPALGRIKYAHNDFQNKWVDTQQEGVLLLIEPNGDFLNTENQQGSSSSEVRFLYHYLKPYKKFITQVLLGLFVASLIQLILPFLTQSIVDYGIDYQNIDFIYLIVIAQFFLFLARAATEVIRDWLLLHIGTHASIAMLSDFFDKLLRLPMKYFDSKTIGDFLQRIYDHERVDEFFRGRALTILFDVFTIMAFGLVLSIFNIPIFVIFLLGSSLFMGWSLLFMKKKEVLDHQLFDLNRREQSIFLQIIMAVTEIKLNSSEIRRKNEWKQNQTKLFGLRSNIQRVDQTQINGGRFINELTSILIIFWSAKAVISGQITLGSMLAIQFIVGSLYVPITNSVEFLVGFQRAKLSLTRLSEIHNENSEIQDYSDSTIQPDNMNVEDMSFGFGEVGTNPILKNINLSIPVGKITAIVGRSGSGKTTLLKLFLKLYEPDKGLIRIGNINLKTVKPSIWREMCGTVLQEGILFNDTIERNITESKSYLPLNHEHLKEAVKIASLTKFIDSLPFGLQTKIGEQGQLLSGGEKQRMLIARAIYKNPDYLFFDEATSSLDAENEKVISENLHSFYKNKTVVIVAHRLSTVKNADQIIVMENGSVVETGNHHQLLLQNGMYYRLIKNQL